MKKTIYFILISFGSFAQSIILPSGNETFITSSGIVLDNKDQNSGNLNFGLRFGSYSGEGIGSRRVAGTNRWGLDLYTNNLSRMSLTNDGKVGINTNPLVTLDIKSATTAAQMYLRGSTSSLGLKFYTDNDDSFIDHSESGKFEIKTQGVNRFSVSSNGRIGINSPTVGSLSYALEVYDSNVSSSATAVLFSPRVWAANAWAGLYFGDVYHYIKATNSVGMELYDFNKIRLTGGNVGIGTSEPDTKLEVDGFTMLGNDAPKIKMKEFYHININPQPLRTATTEGGTITYDLGINAIKILAVNIFVDYGSVPFTNTPSDRFVPPAYTHTNGYQFDYYLDGTTIFVRNHPTNSENILDKYIKILVTYKE